MNRSLSIVVALALSAGAARAASFEEGMALKKESKLAAAETVFAEVVREHPEDPAALEQWATLLGWLGRFDDSIAAWRRALDLAPEHPDYAVGLSRAQYWKGELAPARARLEGLLATAPDNVNALTLAGDVCAAQRDRSCAHDDYARALALAPSAELEKKLADSAGPLRWRFDAGGQLDAFDTGRGTEGSFFAQASWQALGPLVLSGGYEQLRQLDAVDHRFNLGFYLHPIDRLLLSGRAAVSPTADTIASWEASGGAELTLAGPLTALANVRHLDFTNQGVTIAGAGARVDIGRASIVGQGGIVHSTVNPLQGFGVGRIEYELIDHVRVYAGFARGAQAQLLLPPAVATDVIGGVLWTIDRRWSARLDYTYEAYGDFFVRNSLGTALTIKL